MRLIDADKLIEEIKAKCIDDYEDECSECEECPLKWIESAPIIEAEPVKHGKWKHVPGMNSKCSECGRYFPVREFESRPFDINYCPNCGAKMEEEDDDCEQA